QGRPNAAIGAPIGSVLLGAAAAAITSGHPDSAYSVRTASQLGMRTGAMIGHLSFSKEQEREADYLGALILYRAGVDLDKARGVLVKIARLSGDRETGLLDTHPVGPERIAGWDTPLHQIPAPNAPLPPPKPQPNSPPP